MRYVMYRYVWLVGWLHVSFSIMERIGPNQRRRACFVKIARWRHRGRRLPSPTAFIFKWEHHTGYLNNCEKITSEPPQRFHGTFTYIAVTGSRPLFCRQTLFPFLPRPYFLLSLPSPLSSSFSLSTSHYFTLSFHSSNYFFHAVIHEI